MDANGLLVTPAGSDNVEDFGNQLALCGDRLAVGTFGPIRLFEKRQRRWSATDSIELSAADSRFSSQGLVYSQDTLAFSVYETRMDSVPGSRNGTFVYLYRVGDHGKAHLLQKLAPAAGDTGGFGKALALKNDLLVIGSPGGIDYQNGAPPGQVYVYSRRGDRWTLEQRIQSPTGAPNSDFGAGVAIGHHAILVGAPAEDFIGDEEFTSASGELHVFAKVHGVWAQTQETRPSDSSPVGLFNGFGAIIATGGGRVVIGAPSPTDVFGGYFGPTVIYRWEADTLVLDNYISSTLAASLDVSGNRIIVGENTQTKYGFYNQAVVLTYPAAAHSRR